MRERELTEIEWAALERNLQLALECALDVGDMIIAWRQLPRAQRYADVFRILGDAGVIDRALADRLTPAAKLRNVLVHMYEEVDRKALRQSLAAGLDDLASYARAVSAFAMKMSDGSRER